MEGLLHLQQPHHKEEGITYVYTYMYSTFLPTVHAYIHISIMIIFCAVFLKINVGANSFVCFHDEKSFAACLFLPFNVGGI